MRKLAFIAMVVLLISTLVGCGNKVENVQTNVEVNIDNLELDESTEDTPRNEGDDSQDSSEEEGTDGNQEQAGSGNDDSEDQTEETEEDSNVTEGESTEGSTEETSEGSEGEESGAENTEEESDITEPEEESDITEPEEEIDYTANISKPYDDVDYTPQIKKTDFENNPAINVKGVFITANTAQSERIHDFVTLLNETELNALVIDVKNDDGDLLFYSEAANKYVPDANNGVQIKDMEAFMKLMKDNNIYTIARIVTFKSPKYATLYPERAIAYKSSGNLYYADGAYWASPFDQDLWQYNVEVAKEAISHGFNEIQFDYVRFPATGSSLDKNLDFKNENENSKTFAVQEFVKYAYNEINALEAYVALDVFGWTATTTGDSGIGQHWEGMSNVTDYMCPMVYPSHYGEYNFGIQYPDTNPYKTVFESMKDAVERNNNIETPGKLRPWLQGFTASYLKKQGLEYIPYRRAEIQAQIQACKDLGIEDYIFWNSSNKYTTTWFNEAN